LGRIGPAASAAVPELGQALTDPVFEVRASVAFALGRIGSEAHEAIPSLAAAMRDPSPVVRWASLWALDQIGPKGDAVVQACRAAVADPMATVRFVEKPGHPWSRGKPAVVPVLDELSKQPHRRRPCAPRADRLGVEYEEMVLRQTLPEYAARLLGEMGPAAREAVPNLVAALQDPITGIRREAGDALKKIDPEAAAHAGVK
jgi:HEAT repeat protein